IVYHAPEAAISSNGEWLVWAAGGHWTAATLDGLQEARWRQHGFGRIPVWLPGSSHRWVEPISEYRGGGYAIPRLLLHSVHDPQATREVSVSGLEDGLIAGITQ